MIKIITGTSADDLAAKLNALQGLESVEAFSGLSAIVRVADHLPTGLTTIEISKTYPDDSMYTEQTIITKSGVENTTSEGENKDDHTFIVNDEEKTVQVIPPAKEEAAPVQETSQASD